METFVAYIDKPSAKDLIDALNEGRLPSRIARLVTAACRGVPPTDYMDEVHQIERKEVDIAAFSYETKRKGKLVIHHRNEADEITLMFLALFVHREVWRDLPKNAFRCPMCGKWFFHIKDTDLTCGPECTARKEAVESKGVLVHNFWGKDNRAKREKKRPGPLL